MTRPLLEKMLGSDGTMDSALAIVWDGGHADRATLRTGVAGLAEALRRQNVGKGDRVLVCLPKGPAAVAALFACMALGALAVPADPSLPLPRLNLVAQVCKPALLITATGLPEAATQMLQVRQLVIGDLGATFSGTDTNLPMCDMAEDDGVLILMTSGSTGLPKAVEITQGNLRSFLDWAISTFNLTARDRFVNLAPLYFDLSIFDIMASQSVAACVYLARENEVLFPGTLVKLLARTETSVLYTVPTILRSIVRFKPEALCALRLVLFAGEVMPRSTLPDLRAFAPNAEMANLYGPTETNVVTWHSLTDADFRPSDDFLPVGRACPHATVTVRDESGQVVPDGAEGEICIEGPSVMRGYFGQPEKTALSRLNGKASSYRTGDFGWWANDGTLRYAGRRDQRVKLRGNLVDLGEVEAVAARHPGVAVCAAVVEGAGSLSARLILHFTPAAEYCGLTTVADWLADHLPRYAVPSRLQEWNELPRMTNGKLDKIRLAQGESENRQECTG